MRYRSVILWGLFIGIILLGAIYTVQEIAGESSKSLLNFAGLTLIGKMTLGLAAALLILHSVWTLGTFKGATFVALSFMIGLFFEVVGVNYAAVFGGHYVYNPAIHPRILNVPLLIPLIWAGFIYGGYSIVSSFFIWLNRSGFGTTQSKIMRKVSIAAFSALVVLAIDLFMDPLQVEAGNWKWLEGGRYFNIPAGNFLGWFLVAFLSILIFMILQDYLPEQQKDIDRQVLLIPVLGYGLLCMISSCGPFASACRRWQLLDWRPCHRPSSPTWLSSCAGEHIISNPASIPNLKSICCNRYYLLRRKYVASVRLVLRQCHWACRFYRQPGSLFYPHYRRGRAPSPQRACHISVKLFPVMDVHRLDSGAYLGRNQIIRLE